LIRVPPLKRNLKGYPFEWGKGDRVS